MSVRRALVVVSVARNSITHFALGGGVIALRGLVVYSCSCCYTIQLSLQSCLFVLGGMSPCVPRTLLTMSPDMTKLAPNVGLGTVLQCSTFARDGGVSFERWLVEFETELTLVDNGDGVPTRKRLALLRRHLDEGARETLRGVVAPDDNWGDVTAKLVVAFNQRMSLPMRRYRFNAYSWRLGETVRHTFDALTELASVCEYGEMAEQLVVDRVLMACRDVKIKEAWLALPMMNRETMTAAAEKIMQIRADMQTWEKNEEKARCPVCGGFAHPTSSGSCPSAYRMQTVCNRITNRLSESGCHYRNVDELANKRLCQWTELCRGGEVEQLRDDGSDESERCNVVNSISLDGGDRVVPTIMAKLEAKNFTCSSRVALDSGASVSVVSLCRVPGVWRHGMMPAPGRLRDAAGVLLPVRGVIDVLLTVGQCQREVKFWIVDGDSDWTLGWRDMVESQIIKLPEEQVEAQQLVHRILLKPEAKPVRQRQRLIPLAIREEVMRQVKEMEREGIIEPTNSAHWIANLVPVRKEDGRVRVCLDLTSLNEHVVDDVYPLPHVEDLLARFGGGKVFAKIDLKNAYLQVKLHPESRPLTAFWTPKGLYQYTRMPFGLVSAAAFFQRNMEMILCDLPRVLVYIDDILVAADGRVELEERVQEVLARLEKKGLTVNLEKSVLCAEAVEFLGFLITEKGVGPKERRIRSICEGERPGTVNQMRSWLGMVSYYSRFVANFSSKTAPLRAMCRGKGPVQWSEEAMKAFECLKNELTVCSALGNFVPSREVRIYTDASRSGLGAVLVQVDEKGDEVCIEYASRGLNRAEKNYAVIELELLAVSWAVQRFRNWILGSTCQIRTDHAPLIGLWRKRFRGDVTPRLGRLLSRLSAYSLQWKHIKGVENGGADWLSRRTRVPPDR